MPFLLDTMQLPQFQYNAMNRQSIISKGLEAIRHPSKIAKKARECVNRVSSLALEPDLLEAYTNNGSRAHLRLINMGRRYYGLGENTGTSLRKALSFRQRLYFAQDRLFRKGKHFELGVCSLGFKGLRVQCASDSVAESAVYLDGFYDELTVFQVYEAHLAEGDVVVDIGANVGFHSLALSRIVGNSGKVYAYEPTPKTIDRLRLNLSINQVENVIIRQTALGERVGEIPFYDALDDFNHGVARFDPDGNIRVSVVPLDEELKDRDCKVSLIKIDVEGFELRVIQGAQKLLALDRPIIVVEYNSPPWSLEEFVRALPFKIKIYRIPNTFHETLLPLDVRSSLPGFNNLLLVPLN